MRHIIASYRKPGYLGLWGVTMKYIAFLFAFCLSLVIFGNPVLAGNEHEGVAIRILTDLDFVEPNEAHLFHDDHLWVGKSRTTEDGHHRMEVYSSEGSLVSTIELPHSPRGVYPLSDAQVVVTGRTHWPWKTHYTVVTRYGHDFVTHTTTLPEEYQADEFVGDIHRMFFTEPGEAKVFQQNGNDYRFLSPVISGPGKMLLLGDSLFVIERRDASLGDENLVKIDLKTETADKTFKDYLRNGLSNIISLPQRGRIAAAETVADQVLLIDVASNKLVETLAVHGRPRGLATLGNCLVVSSEETRRVRFFDLGTAEAKLIDEWDLSVVGNKLRKARSLAVDPNSGRVYVRSTYICPSSLCVETMSSVVMAEQLSKATYARCTGKKS